MNETSNNKSKLLFFFLEGTYMILLDTSDNNIPSKLTLPLSNKDTEHKINLGSESEIDSTVQTAIDTKDHSHTNAQFVRPIESGKRKSMVICISLVILDVVYTDDYLQMNEKNIYDYDFE